MKKYKFFVIVIPLAFTLLGICCEAEYSLAAEPSLVGTWTGSVEDMISGRQGQLTVVITNDTDQFDIGSHDIEGTVTLTGFPMCFTQGLFSSEIGDGWWHESSYRGTITALGEGFSEARLGIDIGSDLTQIIVSGFFFDSSGNIVYCAALISDTMTKQSSQNSDFSANPISGPAPLTVNFIDQSTGSITSWEWDFGDGSKSTSKNPTHTYIDPGTYTVTLTVEGPEGSDTETKPGYIKVRSTSSAMPWIPLLLLDQ